MELFKLLINAERGEQYIVEVGTTGFHSEQSRVLWDEREDGPLPAVTLGGMVRQGAALVFSQARMDEHVAATAPTEAQALKSYEEAVQQHMEGVARSWGYDNLLTAITYAGSSVSSRFKAEGQALLDWRALVWLKCHEVLAEYKRGERGAPTHAELIAELPAPPEQDPIGT